MALKRSLQRPFETYNGVLYKNVVTISSESKMTRRACDVTRAALCGCGYRSGSFVISRSRSDISAMFVLLALTGLASSCLAEVRY